MEAPAVDGVELLLAFSLEPDFSLDPDFSLEPACSLDPDFSPDPELDSLDADPLVEAGCFLPDSRLSLR